MTSKGLGEMFEADCADTCAGKFFSLPVVGGDNITYTMDPIYLKFTKLMQDLFLFFKDPIKFGQTCAEHSNKLNNLLCPNISKNCSILLLLSF